MYSNFLYRYIILCVTFAYLCTCQSSPKLPLLKEGKWRFSIQLSGGEVPFHIELQKKTADKWVGYIQNASEKIPLDEIIIERDSVKIQLHIFNAALVGKLKNENLIEGKWLKYDFPDYALPFEANWNVGYRFKEHSVVTKANFSGKWQVIFQGKQGKSYEAIGIFEQKGKKVTGTFLTTTGDYRFLEGIVDNNQLLLSTFDGDHAFLFRATPQTDSTLTGEFWAGKSGFEEWTATKNANAQLPDANKLTFLKEGYKEFNFSFPNLKKQNVSIKDAQFQNKVVIVQLFGTWCPNCMDETRFLATWYEKNKQRGVEIIGLAYERSADFEKAKERVAKMQQKLDANYTCLIAGTNNKAEAAKTLPMLNQVLAFPTTIFIDKKGQVRKIHTGFNGPGTGRYYEEFVQEFNSFIDKLLAE